MEILRKTELWILKHLRASLPGWTIAPGMGVDQTEDAKSLKPPFVAVEGQSAERKLTDQPLYSLKVDVTLVTQIDDTPAPEHSAKALELQEALETLPKQAADPELVLTVHGREIVSVENGENEDRDARGTVITLSFGVSG